MKLCSIVLTEVYSKTLSIHEKLLTSIFDKKLDKLLCKKGMKIFEIIPGQSHYCNINHPTQSCIIAYF